ncbi:MAG TPA: hypothetical protein VKY65_21115 [Alphaproteobacteria bacterium]|nr:hypothetical protein [Alphaproteobacteria bacterium]
MRRLFGLGKDADGGGAHLGKGGTVDDHGIVVGQRYIKIDAGPGAWEVLSVFAGPRNMPHARIASLEEPDVVRVVSLAALGDRSRYQPVA